MTLYTIGYEGAALTGFIRTLRDSGITTLIDVRDLAWSRRTDFCKKALSEAVEAAGIRYLHLKGLGNPKPGRDAARAGDIGTYHNLFGAHLETEVARRDLETAARIAREQAACLMCYEADPTRCHRAIVAERLEGRTGLIVEHLHVVRERHPGQLTLSLGDGIGENGDHGSPCDTDQEPE